MPAKTVILLPPSEGKAAGGDGPPWQPGASALAELDDARAEVLAALGPQHPAHTGATLPAIERYTGVLYKELDATSLRGTPRARLRRSVLIASGLWGFSAPMDPLPEYKLKMSANVAPLGKLSTWWRPTLTAALAPRVRSGVVWDLLPLEHSAGLRWEDLDPKLRVTVRFVDAEGKTVSHWNKLLKGSLVRWLVTTGASGVEDLAAFDHPLGYRFDPGATEVAGSLHRVTFRA